MLRLYSWFQVSADLAPGLEQAEQGPSIITELWFMPFLQAIDSCAVWAERAELQSSGKTNAKELWENQRE